MVKRGFFGEKAVSGKDLRIEKMGPPNFSKKTKRVILKSQTESLQALLDPDPQKAEEAMRHLRRQYWNIPEPEKAA